MGASLKAVAKPRSLKIGGLSQYFRAEVSSRGVRGGGYTRVFPFSQLSLAPDARARIRRPLVRAGLAAREKPLESGRDATVTFVGNNRTCSPAIHSLTYNACCTPADSSSAGHQEEMIALEDTDTHSYRGMGADRRC